MYSKREHNNLADQCSSTSSHFSPLDHGGAERQVWLTDGGPILPRLTSHSTHQFSKKDSRWDFVKTEDS